MPHCALLRKSNPAKPNLNANFVIALSSDIAHPSRCGVPALVVHFEETNMDSRGSEQRHLEFERDWRTGPRLLFDRRHHLHLGGQESLSTTAVVAEPPNYGFLLRLKPSTASGCSDFGCSCVWRGLCSQHKQNRRANKVSTLVRSPLCLVGGGATYRNLDHHVAGSHSRVVICNELDVH